MSYRKYILYRTIDTNLNIVLQAMANPGRWPGLAEGYTVPSKTPFRQTWAPDRESPSDPLSLSQPPLLPTRSTKHPLIWTCWHIQCRILHANIFQAVLDTDDKWIHSFDYWREVMENQIAICASSADIRVSKVNVKFWTLLRKSVTLHTCLECSLKFWRQVELHDIS